MDTAEIRQAIRDLDRVFLADMEALPPTAWQQPSDCDGWTIGHEVLASLPFAGPGHAGHFETSCVMAVRPDLPQLDARFAPDREARPLAISGQIHGVPVRYPGIWEASEGVSDAADQASAELGEQTVAAIARATADFLVAFHERPLFG